jgi:predicted nuclease of predicted toxin-antitoxin system
MRVLLDENVDRRLGTFFDSELEVTTVTGHGWSGMKNGDLLRAAEREFDVLVTMDRKMQHQQKLAAYRLGVVLIKTPSLRRQVIEPVMPQVNAAVKRVQPGELVVITV